MLALIRNETLKLIRRRRFAIVVGSLNFIEQLGFFGSSRYPLWALTSLALTAVVLYALIVHWDDRVEDVETRF